MQLRPGPHDVFVGRSAEIARITEVIARVQAGEPWLVAIEGDPGIGKTSLVRHCLAVESAMRTYARKLGEDEEKWGLVGLLHDFDYERWPNSDHAPDKEHPAEGARILRERGYSEEIIRAVLSHADYSNTPRQTPLEHTLFACDELAGFLTACVYVRPSKSILDLEADSVKKKLKDKAFARGVNREDVRNGAAELGVPIEEHIEFCIAAMRENADALDTLGIP